MTYSHRIPHHPRAPDNHSPSYAFENSQLLYLPITDPYPHEEDLLNGLPAQGQGPATGMSDYRTMPSQQHHYPPYQPHQQQPPPPSQQQQQLPQQQQHYVRPNYQHQQGHRPPHPATSQQQHQHMAPIPSLARSATDLAQRMGDMKLNGDPQPYGAKMPSRTPGPMMPSLPKQRQQQYIPRAYGNGHGHAHHNHPAAAAPLGGRKHSPVQQTQPAPAPAPIPIPMPYDAQTQSSYRAVPAPVPAPAPAPVPVPVPIPMPHDAQTQPSYCAVPAPVPAPAPAPAHTPGSGRRASHVAMVRRSVTAPLPPISTDMEAVPDLPAVTSTTTSPARAPAYPGQRVYSPITKDMSQHSKTSSPQRPPSIPPKIPEDQDQDQHYESPVRSLNASLGGSAGNISPTMHASASYHDNAPMAAVNETAPEGFEFLPQEDAYVEATNGDVAQDHQLYTDNLPENASQGDFIFAFPPQTPSKEGFSHQPSSPSVPPVVENPPESSSTPTSLHTPSSTASHAPREHRNPTPVQRPGSAPTSAPTNTNPTPPGTGYVAYKPYNPSASSSTPSPTRTSLPNPPLSTAPSTTLAPFATASQPGAYPTPPPPSLSQAQGPASAPISMRPAVPMIPKRGQPSPVRQQFVEAEVRNVRSASPRGPVFPGPGHGHGLMPGGGGKPALGGGPYAPPPPMRHMPTAPAGGLREKAAAAGTAAAAAGYFPPMPHPAAAGRHMPSSGPGALQPPPGPPKRVMTGPIPPHPAYAGRSATMTSMTPPPMHDKQVMPPAPYRGTDPTMGSSSQPRAFVPEAKPVPFRPGLQPIRQHGSAPMQGPSPAHNAAPANGVERLAPAAIRSATMTSMTSAAGPGSALSGAGPQSGPGAAGSSTLTIDELRRWQSMSKANPNDDRTQYGYAKKLLEASKVLVARNTGDSKQKMRQKHAYIGEGIKIMKRCAHRNYPEAMFFLGDCYTQGSYGMPKEPKEAYTLYNAAAKAGHGPSAYRTAVCCELGPDAGTRRDPMKAVQWYRRAATLGDPPAMYKFGHIQLKGLLGQPRNPREAITWLKRAAERADEENPHALHELSQLYADPSLANNIIIQDEAYAMELLIKAGELGYKYSQLKLGQIYEHGLPGQTMNPRLSIYWYTRGAAQGEHMCELALSGWYLTGSEGVLQPNDMEAYLWARKAAMAGLAKAEYAMGYFTEAGIGVPSNLEEAKKWYWKASSQNFMKARERLEDLKRGGAMMEKSKLSREGQHQNEPDCVLM